jgi:Ca2+-binding RTX toxin-like protein
VNDAPVNVLSTSFILNEDTVLKLSGLSVTDTDAGTGNITVTLSVPSGNGAITATSTGVVMVSGSGTNSITLTGTLANINAYLVSSASQPSYTPLQDASGTVQLTMVTSDLGNTGTGGVLTDTDTINITINPIADPISDPSSVSVVIGAAINNTIDLNSGGSALNGTNTFTYGNGVVMSSGSGANFNWTGGNTLGIDGGGSSNRIEGSESVMFSFPSGMQYMGMQVKNAADDTLKITAGLEVQDLSSSGTITGQVTSSLGIPSALNMQVSLLIQYMDGTSSTASATVSLGGAWTLSYNTGGKAIASATVTSLIDGDLFSQGGGSAGATTFTISTDMKNFTISQDSANTYSFGANNNGFQIQAISANASTTGNGYSYPVDLYALNPDPSETITSLKLSDLPVDTQALTVVLANGSYVEIQPVGGVYDLSSYTSLLSSYTGTKGVDKIYLSTSTALSAGFAPTMTLETVDGSTTSLTIIGGSASSTHSGGIGNDYINGGAGDDTLAGGAGNDTLTGGLGNDVFKWNLADAGTPTTPAVDRITDFNTTASTDKLDLRDLLTGESHTAASLDNYLHFEVTGGNTIVHISSAGGFGDNNPINVPVSAVTETQQIVMVGVDLSAGNLTTDQQIIQSLINNQKLITD